MYGEWESTTTIPSTLKVGGTELTLPQYQYAMCKLLVDLKSGSNSKIDVLSFKAADYPTKDSYDQDEIAVTNGPSNSFETGATEDLTDIARRMIKAMNDKGQVPNQTIFKRTDNIAFCTNRATVTMARAISEYKDAGKMPAKVLTEYLSASATLKGFAQQLVSYLDVWDKTTGSVDADGSHCTSNKSAWENVHFIPIPYSGGYEDGTMYGDAYKPYHTITVDGVTYDAAQCWVIALKGIMDLVTVQGSALKQTDRNTTVHTLGNGKALSESIPEAGDWALWGSYPWYEKADDPCAINFSKSNPCDLNFLIKVVPWFLTRAEQLTHIGNFQTFGDNPANNLVLSPYTGNISAMRTFLIAIRFYKYLLDNNISSDVYTAMKDVDLDYDLYGVELPDIESTTTDLTFAAAGETIPVTFNAAVDWTATSNAAWLTVNPGSGSAATGKSIDVSAIANTGAERTAILTIAGGNATVRIPVTQNAYTNATIKDFAKQFVTILDTWQNTTGIVNTVTGLDRSSTNTNYSADNDVENAHYVPSTTTITLNGKSYSTADMMELAERCYLLLRGYDGTYTDKYGADSAPKLTTAGTMATALPETHNYVWSTLSYNESGSTNTDGTKVGNGGPLMMGSYKEQDKAVANTVKLDIMDNFTQRHLNWPITKGSISNNCGYPRDPITNYYGCFSAQRSLLTFARIFKYLLDNNLDNAVNVSADQTFNSDLLGVSTEASKNTIEAFAKQYVTILDVWEKTTGTINFLTGETLSEDRDTKLDNAGAHYVPSGTTIKVNGTTYSTGDMLEVAERCYLLLRGYDGNSTTAGKGTFEKTATQSKMTTTEIPTAHKYVFQSASFNESGSTASGNVIEGNGGHLRIGDPATANGVACKVKVDILDNFAQRHVNYGITRDSKISNMCGYAAGQLSGYYGCFSAQRALVTYAFFFKYMIDNKLADATGIAADQTIRSEEFGDEK